MTSNGPFVSEIRETARKKPELGFGCLLWPAVIGLLLTWVAGRFESINCFHAAAAVAFAAAVLGFRLAVVDRWRRCPHGVRGAVASPPLCSACLAEKKRREHLDRAERKRRGSQRRQARRTDSAAT
jgi:hypothetical protein